MDYTNTVNNLTFPERWIAAGVEPPTPACKLKTIELLNRLHIEFNLKPVRIAPTIEEGVFILYKNNNFSLNIEIYNDLEMVYFLSNGDSIISDIDVSFNDTVKCFLNISKLMEG